MSRAQRRVETDSRSAGMHTVLRDLQPKAITALPKLRRMKSTRRSFIASGLAAATATTLYRPVSAASADGPSVLCIAGDTLITRRVQRRGDSSFGAVAKLLQNADVGIASGVMTFERGPALAPFPKGIDLNLLGPASGAADLRWMGLRLLSYAGNHALDYGIDGLRATLHNLRQAAVGVAGAGETLEESARPSYADHRTGRVALIGCATTFPESWMAANARHDAAGRPGVNGIRLDLTYRLAAHELEQLSQIGRTLAPGIEPLHDLVPDADGLLGSSANSREGVSFLDRKFVRGEPGVDAVPRAPDMKRLFASIEEARRSGATACVMVHEHGTYGPGTFLQKMARDCIDAGADCFLVSGSHIFGAIEIYRRKPILYGLGNLFFEYDTLSHVPAEVFEAYGFDPQRDEAGSVLRALSERYFDRQPHYWESAIVRLNFRAGECLALEIHPISLRSSNGAVTVRGTPRLASAADASGILERIANASRPFGTLLSIDGSIGLIRP